MASLFVRPSLDAYDKVEGRAYQGCKTYSHYNYLRPGLVSWLKRRRFETALRMARPWFGRTSAIDFGCADGILIPSLSRHFQRVLAVDRGLEYLEQARALTQALKLDNVTTICNADMTIAGLREKLGGQGGYQVLFLLETLEHVGDVSRMYESRTQFVRELFTLLDRDGVIIASVPRMVGLAYLAKYTMQATLRLHHEHLTPGQLFKASFLRNTDEIEPLWNGGHIGFNHLKLERHLREAFPATQTHGTLTSVFFVIRKPG